MRCFEERKEIHTWLEGGDIKGVSADTDLHPKGLGTLHLPTIPLKTRAHPNFRDFLRFKKKKKSS